ncbi:DUF4393 domain-containing protein [Deinococcus marmoris]|uniref:DUF4393 domain-containing protein n=1 Tax=Deinococcus marmoris TaxID=249408 RepID=UPI00096AC7CF|nr:DUF4393 domain-containing protein [Deinococcus marmoris]
MSEDVKPDTAMQIAASLADDVYKGGVQSSVQTIGQALDGILKAISHYPRYWGMMSDISLEIKEEEFREKLQAKVDKIPDEKRVLPKPNILGPSIQALEYGIFEDHLSEMFASLIASAMNKDTQNIAHPSYVEIIKQLNSDEAILLSYLYHSFSSNFPICDINKIVDSEGAYQTVLEKFTNVCEDAKCVNTDKRVEIIENLERLKLLNVTTGITTIANKSAYKDLEDSYIKKYGFATFDQNSLTLSTESTSFNMNKGILKLTAYGRQFSSIVLDKSN